MMKRILLTTAIASLLLGTAQASAIYPVGAKSGFLIGGQFGLTSPVSNITGINAEFDLGYDFALNRMFSLGFESGAGIMPFVGSKNIYAFTLPVLATAKLVFHNGFNLVWKAGATGVLSSNSINSDHDTSLSPTLAFGVGYKPANSWNITLTYTERLHMKLVGDSQNVGAVNIGFTYTFGANPIDQSALLASKYNVHNGIPWYR